VGVGEFEVGCEGRDQGTGDRVGDVWWVEVFDAEFTKRKRKKNYDKEGLRIARG
jgi:hypothetical protein